MAQEESEDEQSNDDQKSEGSQSEESEEEATPFPAPTQKGKAQKVKIESDSEEIDWEEYCYVCQDGGNVMCCESCSQVAHYKCAGLRVAPKGEWYCKDCSAKRAAAAQ